MPDNIEILVSEITKLTYFLMAFALVRQYIFCVDFQIGRYGCGWTQVWILTQMLFGMILEARIMMLTVEMLLTL